MRVTRLSRHVYRHTAKLALKCLNSSRLFFPGLAGEGISNRRICHLKRPRSLFFSKTAEISVVGLQVHTICASRLSQLTFGLEGLRENVFC
jgi:hypothetical protein